MLGINLVFAGFALSLNSVGYKRRLNRDMVAFVNLIVGLIILYNSMLIINSASPTDAVSFAAAAGGLLFAFNYIFIFGSYKFMDSNFVVFGYYQLFAAIFSLIFSINSSFVLMSEYSALNMLMPLLWLSWAVLWGNGYLDSIKKIPKCTMLTPVLLLFNGILTTGLVGFLILTGVL